MRSSIRWFVWAKRIGTWSVVLLGLAWRSAAWAQVGADEGGRLRTRLSAPSAQRAAEAGNFLPFVIAPGVVNRAQIAILSGYDSARGAPALELTGEARVWGPIAVRIGVAFASGAEQRSTVRPTGGVRVQVLKQARFGVDATVGVFYRPEGLTEGEGEIEAVVALGRRSGKTAAFLNLIYGQDFEGRERDGEVRLGVQTTLVRHLNVGFDSRVRFDAGSDRVRLAQSGRPNLDFVVGPAMVYTLGPVALVAHVGAGGLRLPAQTEVQVGAVALAGIGASF